MIGFPGVEQAHDPGLSTLERAYVRAFGFPASGLRIRLRRVLPLTRGSYRRILDAGSGLGVFTMELAKEHPGAEVVGVELEQVLVERGNVIAQRAGLKNCRFVQGDVTDLRMEEEFDLVVSVDNLEHVEDDSGAIWNLRDALVPGGKLVLHTPGYYRRWPVFRKRVNFEVPGHVRPGYHAEELRAKLAKASFTVDELRHTYGFLETVTNNISYMITGAEGKNRHLYSLVFPFLLALSYLGQFSRPSWGAGVLAIARRPEAGEVYGVHGEPGAFEA